MEEALFLPDSNVQPEKRHDKLCQGLLQADVWISDGGQFIRESKKPSWGQCRTLSTRTPGVVTLLVNGKPLEFKIDTSADVMIIPKIVFDNFPGAQLLPATKTLSRPSQKILPMKAQFKATLTCETKRSKRMFSL